MNINSTPWITLSLVLVAVACSGPQKTSERASGRGELIRERGAEAPAEEGVDKGAKTASAEAAVDTRHRVQLSPPQRVGDRGKVTYKAVRSVTQQFGVGMNVPPQTRVVTVILTGTETVREVSKDGRSLWSDIEVERCDVSLGETSQEVLQAGAVVSVKRTGPEPRLLVDGAAAGRKAAMSLRLLFSTKDLKASDHKIFGTDEPRAVGDSWGHNTEAVAELFSGLKMVVDPQSVSGSSTLTAVKPCGKTRCQVTTTSFQIADFRPAKLRPNMDVVDTGFTGFAHRTLAVDPRLGPSEGKEGFVMEMTLSTQRGDQELQVKSTFDFKRDFTWQPLQPAAP